MCIGAKIAGEWLALDLIRGFVDAQFGGEDDFQRRIEKMAELERR
jgi:ribose 5-phosphate isomerase RpiB